MQKHALLFLLSLLSLTSCASKFSSSQLAKMSAVHVPAARTVAGAYKSPNFTSADDASMGGAMSGAAGFGLVGALVSEIYMASERAGDASRNRKYTDAIAMHVPTDLSHAFTEGFQQSLRVSPFFASKLTARSDAPMRIEVTLKSHRLNSIDELRFEAIIHGEMKVFLDGKVIRTKNFCTMRRPAGRNGKAALTPPSGNLFHYAADRSYLRLHFEQSARLLAREMANDLTQASMPR